MSRGLRSARVCGCLGVRVIQRNRRFNYQDNGESGNLRTPGEIRDLHLKRSYLRHKVEMFFVC